MNQHVKDAQAQLNDQGWTTIPDEGSSLFRVQVTKGLTGRYVSYYDPELRVIVIALHSKLREALGI